MTVPTLAELVSELRGAKSVHGDCYQDECLFVAFEERLIEGWTQRHTEGHLLGLEEAWDLYVASLDDNREFEDLLEERQKLIEKSAEARRAAREAR